MNILTNSSLNQNNQILSLLSKAICYYQKSFIQYLFLSTEKHKLLKEHLKSKPEDIDTLRTLFIDLIDFLNSNLRDSFQIGAKYLLEYYQFDRRSSICKPRICLKTTYDGNIFDLFRDRGEIHWPPFPIQENSGFEYIIQNKTGFYLCNNIPDSAATGLYKNLRLDMKKVLNYKKTKHLKNSAIESCEDKEWALCWKSSKNENTVSDHESWYKSTLIIPIALRHESLSKDFLKNYGIKNKSYIRTIYGFLCFDHRTINFFNEESDINIGYIFADIIALYMITRLTYMSKSKTFNYIQEILTRENKLFTSKNQ